MKSFYSARSILFVLGMTCGVTACLKGKKTKHEDSTPPQSASLSLIMPDLSSISWSTIEVRYGLCPSVSSGRCEPSEDQLTAMKTLTVAKDNLGALDSLNVDEFVSQLFAMDIKVKDDSGKILYGTVVGFDDSGFNQYCPLAQSVIAPGQNKVGVTLCGAISKSAASNEPLPRPVVVQEPKPITDTKIPDSRCSRPVNGISYCPVKADPVSEPKQDTPPPVLYSPYQTAQVGFDIVGVKKNPVTVSKVNKFIGSLNTCGRFIVNDEGYRFKLTSVNWHGFNTYKMTMGGLDKRPLADIIKTIKNLPFTVNSVRIPFSNDMLTAGKNSQERDDKYLAANPDMKGKTPLEVLDMIIDQLTKEDLVVILDNHSTRVGECCMSKESGLWFDADRENGQTTQKWVNDWVMLADRYKGNSKVVGFDLRNEIRTSKDRNGNEVSANWGENNERSWKSAVELAAKEIHAVNPNLLIMIGGERWSSWFNWIYADPPAAKKVVYSPHEYADFHYYEEKDVMGGLEAENRALLAWKTANCKVDADKPRELPSECSIESIKMGTINFDLVEKIHADDPEYIFKMLKSRYEKDNYPLGWGRYLRSNNPKPGQTAPLWISEIGHISWVGPFFRNFVKYLAVNDLDWAWWMLNPDTEHPNEASIFNILDDSWTLPFYDERLTLIQTMDKTKIGPGVTMDACTKNADGTWSLPANAKSR